MAELQEELPRIADAGGQLVAISSDTPEKAAEVSKKHELGSLVLPDTKMTIAKAFGVRQRSKHAALPACFVIGKDGKIAFAYVGVEASDRPSVEELIEALAGS